MLGCLEVAWGLGPQWLVTRLLRFGKITFRPKASLLEINVLLTEGFLEIAEGS